MGGSGGEITLRRWPGLERNRALPWQDDDSRGRDVFKGYMSTRLGPRGRCCWDPKLAPIVTPGPTTRDDDTPLWALGRDVKGLPFGRRTEKRGGPGASGPPPLKNRPRRSPASSIVSETTTGETKRYELFGQTYDVSAEPYGDEDDPRGISRKFAPPRAKRRERDPSSPLKALQRLNKDRPYDFAFEPSGPEFQRFLTADRVSFTNLPKGTGVSVGEPGLGLVEPIKFSVLSPGPVYDLRVNLKRAKPMRPAAFTKEEKFEQARYDSLGGMGTFMPPSFTPSPLHRRAPLAQNEQAPCSVVIR